MTQIQKPNKITEARKGKSSETNGKKLLLESAWFQHCLRYQKIYLLLLFFFLSALILYNNLQNEKPLLGGAESYYHLSAARAVTLKTAYYYPLSFLEKTGNQFLLAILPLFLAVLTLLFIWKVFQRINLSPLRSFIFSLLLIFTPAFLRSATTLSSSLLFFFLLSFSFYFFMHPWRKARYWALLPTILLACIDQWSALLAAVIFILAALHFEKEKHSPVWVSLAALFITLLFTSLTSELPFTLGPFHSPQLARDLISDLGGYGGMSFFVFILAILGFILSWPKRISVVIPYLALPLLIPGYIYNTETILLLTVVFVFFATEAIVALCEREWKLPPLQKFTLLLLFLGILFSALTYVSHLETVSPTLDDKEVLSWMSKNLPSSALVASLPEDANYVRYLAKMNPFFVIQDQDAQDISIEKKNKGKISREQINSQIFTAEYVHQLFPLLEQNKIEYIYISFDAAKRLSPDRGLFFLFQNERFKLLFSAGQSAVWKFTPPQEVTI